MDKLTPAFEKTVNGDPLAAEELMPLLYDELRRLASAQLAQEGKPITLQATGLVHEVYLRLAGRRNSACWTGRRHFFAAAAEAMRHILIDEARRRKALKRGGGWKKQDLQDSNETTQADDELLEIHEALKKLEVSEPEVAEVVRLHFFTGIPFADVAECLSISPRTAHRRWEFARAWLRREMRRNDPT